MNISELKSELERYKSKLNSQDLRLLKGRLDSYSPVYPFNEFEYTLMFLKDRNLIPFKEYEEFRCRYIETNKYLALYGLAPRVFGQTWGEGHLTDLDKRFTKVNKNLDPAYTGQYDLWVGGVRLEVKACRAINTKKRGNITSRAIHYNSQDPFWMNYQQIKPDHCDGFLFIGVWIDRIKYWLLSSVEVKSNKYFSHQHRGGIEYQIGITEKNIAEFEQYSVPAEDLAGIVINKLNPGSAV